MSHHDKTKRGKCLNVEELTELIDTVKQEVVEDAVKTQLNQCLENPETLAACAGPVLDVLERFGAGVYSALGGPDAAEIETFGSQLAKAVKGATITVPEAFSGDAINYFMAFCLDQVEVTCYMATGEGQGGHPLGISYTGNGVQFTLVVDGQPPVVIELDIIDGKEIEIFPDPDDPQVSYRDLPTVACEDVLSLNASVSPTNPTPFQNVIVTVSTVPVSENCDINYTLEGTDGYMQSDTITTDDTGSANFVVPGGGPGVVDFVEIWIDGGPLLREAWTF